MKLFILIVSISLVCFPNSVVIDMYHLIQNRFNVGIEWTYSSTDSLLTSYYSYTYDDSVGNVAGVFTEIAYRRYVSQTDSGLFSSLGFRYGHLNLEQNNQFESAQLLMPYYDIGIKSQFSSRWYSVILSEVGYVSVYTNHLNVHEWIGMTMNLKFQFGYRF